jgi:hypothetical protein
MCRDQVGTLCLYASVTTGTVPSSLSDQTGAFCPYAGVTTLPVPSTLTVGMRVGQDGSFVAVGVYRLS